MNTVKKMFDDMPETIQVPEEFVHKKGKIIIIIDDQGRKKSFLKDFYGSIPDFPERSDQGDYEERTPL
jgi:hypothetical protein